MHYVNDAFEGPQLKPTEPLEISKMLNWMKKADELYLPSIGALTYTISWRDSFLKKSDAELQKYFDNIEVVKYKTRELICKAFLVTHFDSEAVTDAIFLNKRLSDLIGILVPGT